MDSSPTGGDGTGTRMVEAAAGLLASGGRDAVSTRAVAAAAGTQAPTIYRLFGDMDGLLDAVAEHGFASYLAAKPVPQPGADPVEDRKSTRLNSSHSQISYAVFCLKKKS